MSKDMAPEKASLSTWGIDNYVPALITWVYNKVASRSSSIYLARFGVGLTDWRIIAYLGLFDGGTNAQICDYIGLDKAAVSRAVSRLKTKGIAVVTPINRRDLKIELTKEGRELGEEILSVALEIEANLLAGVTEEEKQQLLAILRKVLGNVPTITKAG
ncbi:MAG: winged helix-turn-helix transcriptional regulator [Rhodobacteraceae bacterium]|nr:winged helix-turn-helix transcriptional regulator [Paracoccaceae bacterium]